MRLASLAALIFWLLAAPSVAQTGPAPAALVASFYADDYEQEKIPMSARLSRLYKAARANADKSGEAVAGLDFMWVVNGQDSEAGLAATLKLTEGPRTGDKISIRAEFRNFGPKFVDYDLVLERGRWVVDDIHSRRKPLWTLSKMLGIGATQ